MAASKLSWSDYQKKAKDLIADGKKPAEVVKILGTPVKDGNEIKITSNGRGGIQPRSGNRTAQAVRRKNNIDKGTATQNKALLEQSKNVWNELIPPGKKTFEMQGKTWDYEKFSKHFVQSHNKETRDAAKNNRKLQSWFKGKSSHGHSAGTGTKAHVESHWAFHPQDFNENSEDRGLINKEKLRRIKTAGMALTAEDAARMQLPSGDDLVSDATSGQTRDRVTRGEPADIVKAEEVKSRRKKYLAKGYQDKNGDNGDNGDNGHKNGRVKIKNGDKKKPPNGKGGTPTGTGGGGDIKVTDKKIKNAAVQIGRNLPGALSVPATTTNAYMMIKQALATPSKKNIALAILGGVEAGADVAGLFPLLTLPAEALSQGAGKIGGGLQTMSMLKQLQMNPKINPKALLQSKRLQGAGI